MRGYWNLLCVLAVNALVLAGAFARAYNGAIGGG
jgi:hypothetical protein